MASPRDVVEIIKREDVKIVDIRFMDFPGLWQHFSVPAHELDESAFEDGVGFDASSIRGWKAINESDMLVVPDPNTAFIDPFSEVKTLVIIGDIKDPVTRQDYDRDPRHIAKKAEAYLKETGVGDTAFFGPEAEFFIFDEVKYGYTASSGMFAVDSIEAVWNTDRDEAGGNKGYKIRHKEGYFPVPPSDKFQDLRSEMILTLEEVGVETECHHHEVATAGQAEIDVKFDSLVKIADKLLIYKYVIKNVAFKHGKTVTFMPKPVFGDNGSGMHVHQSIWKNDTNIFAGDGYAGLSQEALYYIGGILAHAKALTAFTNPTTNSYKRLVPGFEAPVNLAYSQRNRSAAVRIPLYSTSPKAKRIEVRFPDPSCNPYLAFSAMLMAGLDGIQNKIDPGAPVDRNIYDLPPEESAKIDVLPGSLKDALRELEKDYEFLLKGDVFTEDVIETWIKYKWDNEVAQVDMRPHPYEFFLYYDI